MSLTWPVGSAQVDPDKAFAVQMTLEESVLQDPVAFIQCALLYTSSNGERRIRWVRNGHAALPEYAVSPRVDRHAGAAAVCMIEGRGHSCPQCSTLG